MKSRACMRFFGGAAALGCAALSIMASSHREAPLITQSPKLDGTDFYIFNSYEPGRDAFVTMVHTVPHLHASRSPSKPTPRL